MQSFGFISPTTAPLASERRLYQAFILCIYSFVSLVPGSQLPYV